MCGLINLRYTFFLFLLYFPLSLFGHLIKESRLLFVLFITVTYRLYVLLQRDRLFKVLILETCFIMYYIKVLDPCITTRVYGRSYITHNHGLSVARLLYPSLKKKVFVFDFNIIKFR